MSRGPLVLVRHGRTAWSAAGRITGWEDPALDPPGEAEARHAGGELAGLGIEVAVVFTSRCRRAVRTAELVLEAAGDRHVPTRADWRLNERHYGQLQGLDQTAVRARFGRELARAWRRERDLVPPEIPRSDRRHPMHDPRYREVDPERLPGAESLAELDRRVLEAWGELAEPRLRAGLGVLVVSHCHALRSLLVHLGVTRVPAPFASTGSGLVLMPDGAVHDLGWSPSPDPATSGAESRDVAPQRI